MNKEPIHTVVPATGRVEVTEGQNTYQGNLLAKINSHLTVIYLVEVRDIFNRTELKLVKYNFVKSIND